MKLREESLDFSKALTYLKAGQKLTRTGWNGNKKPPIITDFPQYTPEERMEYVESLDLVYIKLSTGEIAVCSGCDYEKLSIQEKWSQDTHGYPYFTDYSQGKKTIKLHNYLIGEIPEGYVVDHINGNKLDNRRENLRIITTHMNNINRKGRNGSSVYKGVSYDSSRDKWISSIQINGKTKHIGRFDSEEEAARAYDKESYMTYGEYAKLNFPNEDLPVRMFVVMQKAYPEGIPCNKQTAQAWGLKEGDLFKCNPYFQIKNADGSHSMWVPSVGDLLANDWRVLVD